ncbi:PEP-CTERM sorting domain-containing protein [Paucibacter sp. R3-3]|uniref:PEP-CTERM sorting domain-containing protein n=1 Tax=Roseateles agri TaxID=3098619 RepID=A0ABU5DC66_9BURK|nr:PEP-CTERM sorting domain-containing protein [Paucibacter sp. R3-3]MDY0743882.1 PEP-CTERM sorting domain-containing protein [Paucibacter sp. R3-3]
MKTIKTALACLTLATALPAAATVVVNFDTEAAQNLSAFVDATKFTYAQGAVTIGGVPSPITGPVTNDAVLLAASKTVGGRGSFYGSTDPTAPPTSNVGALTLVADSFLISIADGFNGLFTIDFAGQGEAHLAAFDRAGNMIGDPFASSSTDNSGCVYQSDSDYSCNWKTLSFDLGADTQIYSVEVFGASDLEWFDNITIAHVGPNDTDTVPEPGTIALSLAALGALGWSRTRIALRR